MLLLQFWLPVFFQLISHLSTITFALDVKKKGPHVHNNNANNLWYTQIWLSLCLCLCLCLSLSLCHVLILLQQIQYQASQLQTHVPVLLKSDLTPLNCLHLCCSGGRHCCKGFCCHILTDSMWTVLMYPR